MQLLMYPQPEELIPNRLKQFASLLGLEFYFNYLVTDDGSSLRLNASVGIDENTCEQIQSPDFGEAVCGTVAQSECAIMVEDVYNYGDSRYNLLRSFGINAYLCHPLMAEGNLIGTLSFGRRTGNCFEPEEITLLRTVSDQVGMALHRSRLVADLQNKANDHKQTEAALRESEVRLKVALQTAKLGSWQLDLTTHQLTTSDLCKTNLGLSPSDDLSYQRLFELIHPDDCDRVRAAVRRAIEEYLDYEAEYRVIYPDASIHWVLARGRAFYNNGMPLRMIGVTQDITERKQAQAEHTQLIREQAARAEAEQASQMKDEFLAMISHELQSPLVAILGWTRLLRANPPNPAMLMKSLETIERNATLQAKLIKDLLDISRISAGKLHLSLQSIELQSVIETAIASVSHLAQTQEIDLIGWEIKGQNIDGVLVQGDRDRLQQIICNLLTNAIKFTPKLGSINVELSVIEGHNFSDASYAQICITDTGIGIPAKFLPHVFDRFRQDEQSGSSGGLGLGLAIARHLVELHSGTIHAESPGLGQGATFTIKLPLLRTPI
ncbi:MAG: ATP-binding protein, partial [Cyanobacteriota bacterium]